MTLVLITAASLLFLWTVVLAVSSAVDAARGGQATRGLTVEDREIRSLVARKRASLASLKAIELDHETDKVSDGEYDGNMARASEEAIAVMREMDAARSQFQYQAQIDHDLENLNTLEAHLQAAHSPNPSRELLVVEDSLDQLKALSPAAAMRHQRQLAEASATKCDECGRPYVPGDRFCASCGTALAPGEEA